MASGFQVVLVPVDFSAKTDIAIRKALELADEGACNIYLLHVLNARVPIKFSLGAIRSDAKEKYKEWEARANLVSLKSQIQEHSANIQVHTCVVKTGSHEQIIIHQARKLKADLIVIGQSNATSRLRFFSSVHTTEICKRAGCAVLTVRQGILENGIKKVVVAADDNISQSTLNAISALSKKGMSKIYLVTFVNHNNIPENFSAGSILRLYQWLKQSLHKQVEYAVLRGPNKAKALIKFAENHKADILLMKPESIPKLRWPPHNISTFVSPLSQLQVLLV